MLPNSQCPWLTGLRVAVALVRAALSALDSCRVVALQSSDGQHSGGKDQRIATPDRTAIGALPTAAASSVLDRRGDGRRHREQTLLTVDDRLVAVALMPRRREQDVGDPVGQRRWLRGTGEDSAEGSHEDEGERVESHSIGAIWSSNAADAQHEHSSPGRIRHRHVGHFERSALSLSCISRTRARASASAVLSVSISLIRSPRSRSACPCASHCASARVRARTR